MRPGPTTEELAEIKALRKEVADQQRTIEILKAATTFFAREVDPPAVSRAFVDGHRYRWPVAVMCRTIGLPERTYHAARSRPRSARAMSDERRKVEIHRVWEQNYRCYGARRVYKQLRREGHPIARCTVARLMAELGLRGVQSVASTVSGSARSSMTTENDEKRRNACVVMSVVRH